MKKLIEEKSETHYIIRKGEKYQEKKQKLMTHLTSDIISSENWNDVSFKEFNPKAKGLEIPNGNLHILLKTR